MSRIPSYKGLGASFGRLNRISTATTVASLAFADADALNIWNGQAGPARIMLPRAEDGLIFSILLAEDAVSSATLIGATSGVSGAQDVRLSGTTGGYVQCASTDEGGSLLIFVGVSDGRYDVYIQRRSTDAWVSTSTGA